MQKGQRARDQLSNDSLYGTRSTILPGEVGASPGLVRTAVATQLCGSVLGRQLPSQKLHFPGLLASAQSQFMESS